MLYEQVKIGEKIEWVKREITEIKVKESRGEIFYYLGEQLRKVQTDNDDDLTDEQIIALVLEDARLYGIVGYGIVGYVSVTLNWLEV